MALSQKLAEAARGFSSRFSAAGVTPVCPKCGQTIRSEDINVGNDVAYCRACNLSNSLSQLTRGSAALKEVDLARPPAGTWFRNEGVERVIGATHRSVAAAIGSLFICLFWNGIVSVFVLLATASTFKHLGWPLPAWFPAPNINDSSMGVGMTIFLWIFLTPFIVIGLGLLATVLSCLAGRTEVRLRGVEGVIFTGVGPLGWRRRFSPSEVEEVRLEDQQWRDSDGDRRRKSYIIIQTDQGRTIKFGSMLSEERRRFVAGAVQAALMK